MPRKKKQESEGACPRCRKLVPLVQADGGLLVLRTHHVVINDLGYGVKECEGSRGEPAALDDSEDWGWVAPAAEATREASEPTSLGETIRETLAGLPEGRIDVRDEEHVLTTQQMADVMRASINGAAVREAMTSSTVPEALRPSHVEVNGVDFTDAISSVQINLAPSMSLAQRRTAMRHAARQLRDALEPVLADVAGERRGVTVRPEPDGNGGAVLRGQIQPDGFEFMVHVHASRLADPLALDDLIRRGAAEARTQLEERFRPSSSEFFRNAARSSEIQYTDDDTRPDPIGRVLAEVRQAYIDVTGAPPDGGDVALEDHDSTTDLQILSLRLRAPSGELHVRTAISPSVFGTPGYADEVARDVGRLVRRELRARLPQVCTEQHLPEHECGEPASDAEHVHRCHRQGCRYHWRTPVTPPLGYASGA